VESLNVFNKFCALYCTFSCLRRFLVCGVFVPLAQPCQVFAWSAFFGSSYVYFLLLLFSQMINVLLIWLYGVFVCLFLVLEYKK